MQSLNRVTLIGRLGREPEVRVLEGGVKVGKFSIATNESIKDSNGNWQDTPPEWHEIVVWRNLAERAEKELKKGKLVYLEGKITYRKWQDKEGVERKTTDILCRDFRAFESPERSIPSNFPTPEDDPFAGTPPPAPTARPAAPAPVQTTPPPAPSASAPMPPVEDDLPF